MKVFTKRSLVLWSSAVFALALATGSKKAEAISLPDSSSCSTSSTNGCFKIANTFSTGGTAIVASGTGTGLVVSGSVGVNATSTVGGGVGVIGSSSGVGVYGNNTGAGTGVLGGASSGIGVTGSSGGTSTSAIGVKGQIDSSGQGSAIFGDGGNSITAWAGFFNGDVSGRDFFGNSFQPSDERLKKDIKNSSYGLKDLLKLRPVTYKWKDAEKHGQGTQVGLIAQEVQKIVPELVTSRGHGDELALNYVGLVPVLIKAVQEQQAQIQALKEQQRITAALSRPGAIGLGAAFTLGFVPLGFVVARRARRRQDPS